MANIEIDKLFNCQFVSLVSWSEVPSFLFSSYFISMEVVQLSTSVLPLVGGQVGFQPTRNLGVQLTLLKPGGQIMPTTLLLAHPDLKTQRQLCIFTTYSNPCFEAISEMRCFRNSKISTFPDFLMNGSNASSL